MKKSQRKPFLHANRGIETPDVSLDEIVAREKEITKKLDRMMELYMEGEISKDLLKDRVDKLQEELRVTKIEKRKAINLMNAPKLKKEDFLEFLKTYRLDAEDEEVAESLIETFVDKVIIYYDRIEIKFKIDFNVLGGKRINSVGESCATEGQ